jgi:hypothetical protein
LPNYYEIFDLKALHCDVAEFSREDALGYLKSFSAAYGAAIEPTALLDELVDRRFGTFASHPLLLALICILKTGNMPQLPSDSIGLMRRVLDTLTFKWDQDKGLQRHSMCRLDGVERERCLMRIAFRLKSQIASETSVLSVAREHLKLIHRSEIDVRQLLQEIAQF